MNPMCDIEIDVPFHDVDMLEVVWHGHYYKYFELARTALFRKYNFDVSQIRAAGYSMVVVDSRCRYIAPLRYGMKALICAELVETENRLRIKYLVRHAVTGEKLAKGETVQVTLNGKDGELLMVTPQAVLDAFGIDPESEPVESKHV